MAEDRGLLSTDPIYTNHYGIGGLFERLRAVLHAKCVVIDGRTAFVSSTNFTQAAQERNIEVGVLVRSQIVADRLTDFFAALNATGEVRRAL